MGWGLAPLAVYLAAALIGSLVPARGVQGIAEQPAEHEIVLAKGIIHYDIFLPLNDETRADFAFLRGTRVPLDEGDWLSVGWGSEAFYTSAGRLHRHHLACFIQGHHIGQQRDPV